VFSRNQNQWRQCRDGSGEGLGLTTIQDRQFMLGTSNLQRTVWAFQMLVKQVTCEYWPLFGMGVCTAYGSLRGSQLLGLSGNPLPFLYAVRWFIIVFKRPCHRTPSSATRIQFSSCLTCTCDKLPDVITIVYRFFYFSQYLHANAKHNMTAVNHGKVYIYLFLNSANELG
jgi:hypothetical protein